MRATPALKRARSSPVAPASAPAQGKITRFLTPQSAPAALEAAEREEALLPSPPWGALVDAAARLRWLRAERLGAPQARYGRPYTSQYVSVFGGWSAPGKGQFADRRDATSSEAFGGAATERRSSSLCEETAVLIAAAVASSGLLEMDAHEGLSDAEGAALARLASQGGGWRAVGPLAPDGPEAALLSRGLLVRPVDACSRGALLCELEELLGALSARQVGCVCTAVLGPAHVRAPPANGGNGQTRAAGEAALGAWADRASRKGAVASAAAATRLAGVCEGCLGGGQALLRPSARALDWQRRAQALVFYQSAHAPAEAAALLRADLSGVRFAAAAGHAASAAERAGVLRAGAAPSARWWRLLELSGALEAATRAGMSDAAFAAMHEAASLHLELEAEALARERPPPAAGAADCGACLRAQEDALLALQAVLNGVGLLEREGKYDLALHYLRLLLPTAERSVLRGAAQVGRAHVRLVTNLRHLSRPREALDAAQHALAQPELRGGQRLAVEAALGRLAVPPLRWRPAELPARAEARVETLLLADECAGAGAGGADGDAPREPGASARVARVEARALEATLGALNRAEAAAAAGGRAAGAWRGAHGENGLLQTLCALLLWAPLHDARVRAGRGGLLADAPADLERPHFAERRAPELRACLREVGGGGWAARLRAGWAEHARGAVSRCAIAAATLEAHGIGLAELELVCAGLGGAALEALCARLSSDWHSWKHGLPDLVLWRQPLGPHGAGACPPRAQLIEVKGPGDSLSAAQSAWIDALVPAGADVCVLHVANG